MINKLKYIFLALFCAGLISGAVNTVSAQTNSGKSLRQSDLEKVIGFYEWAFDTKFTNDQRSDYEAIVTKEFQNNPAETAKGINQLTTTYARLQTKSEDEKSQLRNSFIGDFVKQLRNSSEDAEAKFLLNIYESTQSAGEAAVSTADNGDIASLVGKWVWARTGSSSIGQNGVFLGSNGSRFTYQFFPNGTVEFTGIMNVMQGGCNQQIFRSIKGKANLSGNILTINWQPEKFTRDFSCDTAHNYTKTMPAKTEKQQIQFKTDLGQKQMCFVGAECFSPLK